MQRARHLCSTRHLHVYLLVADSFLMAEHKIVASVACFSGAPSSSIEHMHCRLGAQGQQRHGSWHLIRQLEIGRRLDWLRNCTRFDGPDLQSNQADGADSEVPLPLPYLSKGGYLLNPTSLRQFEAYN